MEMNGEAGSGSPIRPAKQRQHQRQRLALSPRAFPATLASGATTRKRQLDTSVQLSTIKGVLPHLPQPHQNIPVCSSYAMSVPYQPSASRRAPSAYQNETPQRQPSVTSLSVSRQAAAAREVAQHQVEETQAAYQQALQKLSSLGVASFADPVYRSQGTDYGQLQKQMAESMYYGLPAM